MFIPLGTNRPLLRLPMVTPGLIVLCLIAYAVTLGFEFRTPHAQEQIVEAYGLNRDLMAAQPWRLLSYAFLHADLWHVLGNVLVLWVFGPVVEDRFGRIGFALFYLAGAAVSGLAFAWTSDGLALGASGAVAAVTGAYLVLAPRTLVRVLVAFLYIGVFELPAVWFILAAVAKDLYEQSRGADGVAHSAHLGGYAFGFLVALTLLATRILKREDFDLFQVFRQMKRRQEIKSAVQAAARIQMAERDRREGKRRELERAGVNVEALRAGVADAVRRSDWAAAARDYLALVPAAETAELPTVLSRRQQLDLCNGLFQGQELAACAEACKRFLISYSSDTEAPHVQLVRAVVLMRLPQGRPEALKLLDGLDAKLRDPGDAELARSLLQNAETQGHPRGTHTN